MICIAGAGALEISPSIASTSVYVNEPYSPTINLINNDNYTIYNLTFSSLEFFSFPTVQELGAGVSTSYNFTILTDLDFSTTPFTSIASFKYLIDVPQAPQTYNITITDTGFSPNDITVYKDDTIIWRNNGTVSHSITSSQWDFTLAVNASQPITFSSLEDISYYDKYIFFTGNIHVRNRSVQEFAHDSSKDRQLTINLDSSFHQTNISLELYTISFTIDWNSHDEALMAVINDGDDRAYNITLSSSENLFEVEFTENNFNLDAGSTNYLTYTISPNITRTAETNRTYNISITLTSESSGGVSYPFSVTVPYYQFENNATAGIDWEGKRKFCQENPTSSLCISDPIKQYFCWDNTTVNDSSQCPSLEERIPTINTNFTEAEWQELLLNIRRSADTSQRVENQWKQDIDLLKEELASAKNISESALKKSQEEDYENEERSALMWIIITSVIVLACLGGIFFMIYQMKKRKRDDIFAGIQQGGRENDTYNI